MLVRHNGPDKHLMSEGIGNMGENARAALTSFSIDWLGVDESKNISPDEHDVEWSEIFIPTMNGFCGTELLVLESGVTLFHAKHWFINAEQNFLPLAKVDGVLSEPSLQIQSALSGSFVNQEWNNNKVLWGLGVDLIRHSNTIDVTPWIFAPQESEFIAMAIGDSILERYIGKDAATAVKLGLGVKKSQFTGAFAVPPFISRILHQCLNPKFNGALKKLHAQSQLLRYLIELSEFINPTNALVTKTSSQSKKRAHDIKAYVEKMGGRVTLSELATYHARSIKTINKDFIDEFNQSIFAFMVDIRLAIAIDTIRKSNMPLKRVSELVGYSHVNHFSAAFKRKFGFSPGSLRGRK